MQPTNLSELFFIKVGKLRANEEYQSEPYYISILGNEDELKDFYKNNLTKIIQVKYLNDADEIVVKRVPIVTLRMKKFEETGTCSLFALIETVNRLISAELL